MLIQKGAGRPRPYDGEGFLGLRGLCVVGIVYCLNQDFQDYQIFRIGSVLYTFRTTGAWNVGFCSSTQPTRCGENPPIETQGHLVFRIFRFSI